MKFPLSLNRSMIVNSITAVMVMGVSSAFADTTPATLVNGADSSSAVVENLAGPNVPADAAVPRELLKDSVCVVSVPGYKRAGFIFGGSYGAGLASCRDGSGQFQTPFT